MSTPYSNIYTKVGILFEDAKLMSLLKDEELEEYLEIFLSKSKSIYFKNCLKDLSNIDNVTKSFNETLTDEEEWIIAEGIRYVWLENQIYREEKLRNKMTTKDYDQSSEGNLLDKLIKLQKDSKKNLQEMIIDYSYNGFEGF